MQARETTADAAERLFVELIELEPALRAAQLAEACAGNAALHAEVQALLDAASDGAAYFDGLRRRLGIVDLAAGAAAGDLSGRIADRDAQAVETGQFVARPGAGLERPGSAVGNYRLISELGSGGMGSVWLAERTDVLQRRQVALKLPHFAPGAWRRAGLAERLAREREILATLEHPHIARLYDAGVTPEGQPWLALEFVRGERIDTFCRARALPVRERLQLFLQMAHAVAHAHAQLVVHRDLKPANVLVTEAGVVKLLDFGIAKLLLGGQDGEGPGLAAETALTRDAGRVLTPDYASPEQILGRPIGTASDVYSLGVVLFELLADVRPYKLPRATPAALEEAIATGEVQRPSALAPPARQRQLRGDLDTIVLKALKREPAERYATVAALAEDVHRHLAHEPVLARPDSAAYRLRTFVRRHRTVVAGVATALLALTIGLALAAWQALEAHAQRDAAWRAKALAEEQAAAARAAERVAVAEADLSSFLVSDLTADRGGSGDMLAQLDRALKMVRAQYAQQPELRGRMLLTLAQNYRWVSYHERADALFAEAEPLLQTAGQQAALAQLTCIRGTSLARAGALPRAREQLSRGTAMAQQGTGALGAQVECLLEAAWVERFAAAPRRAAELAGQALELIQRMGRSESELASEALNVLSRAQFEGGHFRAAAESARRSIAMLRRIGRDHTPGMRNAWAMLAKSLREAGRPLEAEQAHGAEGSFDPAGADLPTPLREDYAMTLLRLGRPAQARALADDVRRHTQVHRDSNMERLAAAMQLRAAAALGQRDEARRLRAEAVALFAALARTDSLRLRTLHLAEMDAALDLGQPEAAQTALTAARQLLERRSGADDPHWLDVHRGQARLALQQGDAARALQTIEPALALARERSMDERASLLMAELLLLRARAHRAAGDETAALADAKAAHGHAVSSGGPGHPFARQAASVIR